MSLCDRDATRASLLRFYTISSPMPCKLSPIVPFPFRLLPRTVRETCLIAAEPDVIYSWRTSQYVGRVS